METRFQALLAAGAAVLALAASAPAAGAATAYVTDDGTEQVLHFEAAPGEQNDVLMIAGSTSGVLEFVETSGKSVTSGPGCAPPSFGSPNRSSCQIAGIDRVIVLLGDRDDRAHGPTHSPVRVEIYGGAGDDGLEGRSGDETLDGGEGNDWIDAWLADHDADAYSGGPGHDRLFYGRHEPQTITLDGQPNDGVQGESDNVQPDFEEIYGGFSDDVIVGSSGDEALNGGSGDDSIDGGAGEDIVDGGIDACEQDEVDGGADDDTVMVGGGPLYEGGPGDDRLEVESGSCGGGERDVFGGSGVDTVDLGAYSGPAEVSLDDDANDGQVYEASNFHSDLENLIAGSGSTALIGSDGPNRLVGGSGDDLLLGAGGSDVLSGGDGVDVADFSDHTGQVSVTLDQLANDGAPGEGDQVTADVEDLVGGDGDDTLVGNDAENVIDGGPGADLIQGGAGIDAVDYFLRSAPVSVDLDGATGDDGEAGEHDTVASDVEGIFGGLGDDTLTGSATDGFLAGFEGRDRLRDPGGMDVLDAGDGDDTLDSVDGAVDAVICGTGADSVSKDAVDEIDPDCEPAPTTPRAPRTPRTPRTPLTPRPPLVPIDHVAPAGTLSLPKGQRLRGLFARGLEIRVRSSEGATVTGVLTPESKSRRVLARGKVAAAGGKRTALKLRLLPAGRKLLRGRRVARVELVVTFTDRAGNARALVRHLRLPH